MFFMGNKTVIKKKSMLSKVQTNMIKAAANEISEGKGAADFKIDETPREPRKTSVRLMLPASLADHLKKYAGKKNLSINETAIRVLQLYLKGK
jgi:hypothetical protein